MNKPFRETVEERIKRDPEFKKALEEEKMDFWVGGFSSDKSLEKRYYYDLISDHANLGKERDLLKEGDEFLYNGKNFRIIEIESFNQTWLIEEI